MDNLIITMRKAIQLTMEPGTEHDTANLGEFKAALSELDDQRLLDSYFYARPAAMLQGSQEAELRREIAQFFSVAMRDVIVTGSAKLGFTLVPKPGRPALSPFGDRSDIDVAIISSELFTRLWREAFLFANDRGDWLTALEFREYLMRGWLRPDKLPNDPDFPLSGEWFEFFRRIKASRRFGPYKITAGVYFDERFWEIYACSSLSRCRDAIERPL